MGIKYKVNSDFFKTWSPKMSYVLGFVSADGSLEDASYLRGKYLRVCSKDLEIIEKIKTVMASEHKIVKIKPKEILSNGKKYLAKEQYLIRIGSHEIYNDLIRLGITPNKSKTIQYPVLPKEFFFHFLRGYLDGDGCIHYYKPKKRLLVVFTSGSKTFLEGLSQHLSPYGFKRHSVIYSNKAFQLRYSTKEAVRLLAIVYSGAGENEGLLLSRKHDIYAEFINRYPKWQILQN